LFFGLFAVMLGLFADKIGPIRALLAAHILLLTLIWLYWKVFDHDKNVEKAQLP